MRKYLWAFTLCGAAGLAVPSWAQERSKSLFGLGRPKPAATPSEKSAKPAKLKNYSELFGDAEPSQTATSGQAPSPAAVQKMIAEADAQPASKADHASLHNTDLDTGNARTTTKTLAASKAPVIVKSSLLDDLDALDELEEQEEAQEESTVAPRVASESTSAATQPAAASEGRVIVRPPVKAKPAVKTVSSDKPAWAAESPEDTAVTADFKPTPAKKPVPSVRPVRTEAPVAARQTPKAPATRAPMAKPAVARATNPRMNTPISVVADSEEISPAEEITPASAAVPASRRPTAQSRLTVTRTTPRSTESSTKAEADLSTVSSAYSSSTTQKPAVSLAQSPTVSVEWRSTGAITVGQESTCELIVKNSGAVNAKDVEVQASFPANVRLVGAEPKPASDSNLVWEFAEIAPGDEKIVHVKFVPVERGEVSASANVRFTGAASTSFAVTEPLLSIKLEGSSEVMVGEHASQTLLISNPGTGTAANVKVEAIIPAGLEHARGERLLMELGNLAPGENRPIRLALTAVAGGRQVIDVHASADNGLVQSAAAEVTVIAPSLAASIEGPSLRYLGRQATYILHVSNDGAAATDNVRVMHKVPDGFEFISAERGAQYDPQNRMLNWFVGRLDRGEAAQVSVVLKAKSTGEFTHFVRATSEHGAMSDTEVTTRIDGAASLVVDVLDLDDPVEVGVETAYEIRVKNEGTASAQNVGLTCELPAGVEFLTASGDSSHDHNQELVVFQPVAEVAAGKTLTYRVKVKGTLSGNMRFRTKVSSDSLAEPLASEEMTKIYGE